MMTATKIVTAANLSKSFRRNEVLRGVDLDIATHEIHALIGRNGTGKTTLLGILAGQLHATGRLEVFGQDPFDNREVMDRVVFTGVDTPYPPSWSARSIFTVAAERYPSWDERTASELIAAFELDTDVTFEAASRGQRSLIAIIVAFAAQAELTLLDEPYLGLDAINREKFYQILLAQQEKYARTIIIATHHLEESAQYMDRFIFLGRDGKITAQHSADELDDAFVVTTSHPELADQAVASQQLGGQTRLVLPRGVVEGTPLPLDEAVRIVMGESDVEL